ncbi:MAG: N-acetylmuramoyl-L-alanine amidase [Methylocella sp.]
MVCKTAASTLIALATGIAALALAASISLGELKAEERAVPADQAPAQPAAVDQTLAEAATLEDSGDQASLVFELSASVDASAFVMASPDRVIVDAPQLQFLIDPEIGKASTPRRRAANPVKSIIKSAGLIASFRFGQLGPGRSRIVIDLGAPARIVRASCEKGDATRKPRLVIELAKTNSAHFAADAQNARAALAPPAQTRIADKIQTAAGKPIVMIDPGHGGIDRGAAVNGLIEKDLVLDFAKALAAKLETDGRYQPVMTREDDSFIPLGERVRMARDRKVALFVSIHADTLADATDVSGATVYTASDRASDAEAARVAEKENQSDAAAGLDGTDDAGNVSDILYDLTRRETRAYSHVFAHTLLNYWKVAARLNKNPQRSAGFRVLKAPDVPSVLVELGYLSNEKDDIALTSPDWRDKASSRMAEAIEAFFAARGETAIFAPEDKDQAPVGTIPDAPAGSGSAPDDNFSAEKAASPEASADLATKAN